MFQHLRDSDKAWEREFKKKKYHIIIYFNIKSRTIIYNHEKIKKALEALVSRNTLYRLFL